MFAKAEGAVTNCTPLWREEELEVKKLKTPHVRSTLGSSDVQKRTPLWRGSTFESKQSQNATCRTIFGN